MSPKRREAARAASHDSLQFSPINLILLGLGLLAIAAGYYALAQGSTVVAPLLLVLGYVVLIPLGIIL